MGGAREACGRKKDGGDFTSVAFGWHWDGDGTGYPTRLEGNIICKSSIFYILFNPKHLSIFIFLSHSLYLYIQTPTSIRATTMYMS
jgi:hypothetical protein